MTLWDDATLGSHDMPEPRETIYDLIPPFTSFPPQVQQSRRSPKRIAVGPGRADWVAAFFEQNGGRREDPGEPLAAST